MTNHTATTIAAILADASAAPGTDVLAYRVDLRKPVSLRKRIRPNTDTIIRSGMDAPRFVFGAGVGVGIVSVVLADAQESRHAQWGIAPGHVWRIDGIASVYVPASGRYAAPVESLERVRREHRGIRTYRIRSTVSERAYGTAPGARVAPWIRTASRETLLLVLADFDDHGHVPMRRYPASDIRRDRPARGSAPAPQRSPRLNDDARAFLRSHIGFIHIGAGTGVGIVSVTGARSSWRPYRDAAAGIAHPMPWDAVYYVGRLASDGPEYIRDASGNIRLFTHTDAWRIATEQNGIARDNNTRHASVPMPSDAPAPVWTRYAVSYDTQDSHRIVLVTPNKRAAVRLFKRLERRSAYRTDVPTCEWTTVTDPSVRATHPVPLWAYDHAVCAHIQWAPHYREHKRFASRAAAVDYFRASAAQFDYSDMPDACMDLYPVCDHCDASENHHDYPDVRYTVGPRGGIIRNNT